MSLPKPYYQDDWATLYHGDCLEVLSGLAGTRFDAVVTDPPYSSGTRTEAAKPSSGAMLRAGRFADRPIELDQMTTTGFVWLIRQVALRTYPLLVDGGSFLCFTDWRQWPSLVGALETVNLRVQTMVVWNKGHFGMGNGFRSQHELVAHAAKGVPNIYDRGHGNVLSHPKEPPLDHPSPKPTELMAELLSVVAPPGGRVLDPFLGSGTTLVAAKRLGMTGVGMETEERYCEVAARRLSQEVLPLHVPLPPRVEQPRLDGLGIGGEQG